MRKQICSLLCALALLFALISTAFAASDAPVRIAVIDTGISTAAISPEHLAEGMNYIRPQDDTEDKLGHGTAVAGILVGSDAADIPGVCPEAVLVPLVWCSKNENGVTVKGKTDMAAQAIYDAVDSYNCRIINFSSGTAGDSAALRRAVEYAEKCGVLVVSAAGNENKTQPEVQFYPAAYDTVLCVGSMNEDGSVSGFSQRNDTLDLLAPGDALQVASIHGKQIRASGTSFSTAYVTGAAARLLAENPALTPAELRALLCETATDLGVAGYDTDSGWGALNLEAALAKLLDTVAAVLPDVEETAWYYDAVKYVYENDYISANSVGFFEPETDLSREALWMALARRSGEVPENMEQARVWVMKAGVSDGTYGANGITREQFVTILWRAVDCPDTAVDLNRFSDAAAISGYALAAVKWAVHIGLLCGNPDGTLRPQGQTTRAQAAVVFQRWASEF